MPGSTTTPGRAGARSHAPIRVAFRFPQSVGARDQTIFAAQCLAYDLPCRRFADVLAHAHARLGADVVCYSFIVEDLHLLLLASLLAHAGLRRAQTLHGRRRRVDAVVSNNLISYFEHLALPRPPNSLLHR